MSKEESKNKSKKETHVDAPLGMRDLVTSVFGEKSTRVNENVPQNKAEGIGTNDNPEIFDGKLVDFRDYIGIYKKNTSVPSTVYLPEEIKMFLESLKNTPELRTYGIKHILSAIVHAYFEEHKNEIKKMLEKKQKGAFL